MKCLLVSVKPKDIKQILDETKRFLFANWKVPVGTVVYFYCSQKESLYWSFEFEKHFIDDTPSYGITGTSNNVKLLSGKVVAKAIVEDIWTLGNYNEKLQSVIGKRKYIKHCSGKTFHKPKEIGYDYQDQAIELSKIEAIEPKDVTEFVSWKRYKSYEKELCEKYMLDEYDSFIVNSMETMIDYENAFRLVKPPQSRTWVYVV